MVNQPVTNKYFASSDPAIVYIFPYVANNLDISLPAAINRKLDDTPFIGLVSISKAMLTTAGDSLSVSWKLFITNKQVKIYITYINLAKMAK